MDLNEYQTLALRTATYPMIGRNLVYPAMGLVGEAGECCDKVKKYWRNNDAMNTSRMDFQTKHAIIKEMGDALWYLAALASELKTDLDTIAITNLEKLQSRRERGVIKSEGDNR